jgi:hypothetical protein
MSHGVGAFYKGEYIKPNVTMKVSVVLVTGSISFNELRCILIHL